MTQNLICCLPTGAGKTLIGCMLISRMKQLNENKKILFLVDRIPLVFQQSEMIEKETQLSCLKCCGDTFDKSKIEKKYDVMVAIATLVINIIEKGLLSLQEFSLIVIDEAHHTTKDHPFSVILRDYYKNIPQEFKLVFKLKLC
jgi:endoribonuclease Dicer